MSTLSPEVADYRLIFADRNHVSDKTCGKSEFMMWPERCEVRLHTDPELNTTCSSERVEKVKLLVQSATRSVSVVQCPFAACLFNIGFLFGLVALEELLCQELGREVVLKDICWLLCNSDLETKDNATVFSDIQMHFLHFLFRRQVHFQNITMTFLSWVYIEARAWGENALLSCMLLYDMLKNNWSGDLTATTS